MNFRVFAWVYFLVGCALFGYSATPQSDDALAGRSSYTLRPQDVIKVQVFQEEDINKQSENLSVGQDGTVTLPLIGSVDLTGKTARQAEEMIRGLYDRDFIVNPQVSVTVVKYADRSVNVIGAVTKQGRIQFPEERNLSVVDAIALADGTTRYADLRRVRVTRANETITVDVDAMMKTNGREPMLLQPGDVVTVPERIL